MPRVRENRSLLLVFLVILAPISGCFGGSEERASADSLDVGPEVLVSGVFQEVELAADVDMSVFVPYLVIDPISGFVQNSTVLDIDGGSSVSLSLIHISEPTRPY